LKKDFEEGLCAILIQEKQTTENIDLRNRDALVCHVPIATKVRRSKLPGYSISLVATAYLRVTAALLPVRGIRATRFMECRRTANAPTPA
jgi:hypothetical protein